MRPFVSPWEANTDAISIVASRTRGKSIASRFLLPREIDRVPDSAPPRAELQRLAQPGARITYANADVEGFQAYAEQLRQTLSNATIVHQGTVAGADGIRRGLSYSNYHQDDRGGDVTMRLPGAYHTCLSVEERRLVLDPDAEAVNLRSIKRGILFVLARWSGASQLAFRALNKALASFTDLDDLYLYLADTDSDNSADWSYHREDAQSAKGRSSECTASIAWLMIDERDRRISWRSSRLGGEALTSHQSGPMIAIRGTPRLAHRHGWRNRIGSVRSRIGAGWIRRARGCRKDSPWAAT